MLMINWFVLEQLQFSFEVGILAIFGHLDAHYREELKRNYCKVDKGYNSFPTKIPGTPYKNAVQVSKIAKVQHSIRLNLIIYMTYKVHEEYLHLTDFFSSSVFFDLCRQERGLLRFSVTSFARGRRRNLLKRICWVFY